MNPNLDGLCGELVATHSFFCRSLNDFTEADSSFAPTADMFTVAQQVAHVARTVDWFVDGALSETGFDHDFEAHVREARAVTSLADARAWLDRSFAQAAERLRRAGAAALAQPLPPGMVMPGMPRSAVVSGIVDHSAHHRGALAVYVRLLGRVPSMPYA